MHTHLQLTKPEWSPDFGPSQFVPQWGAAVVGARTFLIAYNVNLLSTKQQAHRIALNLREIGRGLSEVSLFCAHKFLPLLLFTSLPPHPLPTHTPPPTHQPGRLKSVKALGWYLEEQDVAQVSMNLTDFETTPLHVAFEECCKDARV